MYIPIGIISTMKFGLCNIFYSPVAYLIHLFRLFLIVIKKESGHESISRRLSTFLKFLIVGPFFLLLSGIVDIGNFFYNLFTVPEHDEWTHHDTKFISIETLISLDKTCDECITILKKNKKELIDNGTRGFHLSP